MIPANRIIEVQDKKYYVLSVQIIDKDISTKKLKERWNADTVLKNGNNYWICQDVIDAEFSDLEEDKALEKN